MSEQLLQNMAVKELDEMKLVGFRVLCPGDQFIKEIPKTSMLLNKRINEIKQVMNPSIQVGAFVVNECSNEKEGYWVCVQVKGYKDIPKGMVMLTVPPQKYPVLKYKGPNTNIMSAYNDLHKWVEKKGYSRSLTKWHLEIYHSWEDPKELVVELLDTVE
ncbi:GyrI-like domain-containing protein [Bacillus cereus]|uniref:GyrI-like domain-containing protein n=1 Tax=Bacillus cereus TaxID=1396 RepID=UPI0039C15857